MTDRELERNLIHRVNVGDALTRTASHRPKQLAVVDGARRFTYAELDTWVNRVAHGLLSRGYERGDALALLSGNSVEFLVTYYACAKIGVVCVPLNLGWREPEIAYVLQHSKARGIVVESQLLERGVQERSVGDVFVVPGSFDALSEGQSDRNPEVFVDDRDAMTYLYTSGTTAAPKGVVGTHLAVHLESLTAAIDMQLRPTDRMLCLMPMFHTAQVNAFCTPAVAVGVSMVILRAFDAAKVLSLVESEKLSVLFALPMMYRQLVAQQRAAKRDTSTLRYCVYAMTPMPDHELRAALDTFKCDFALLFGQTEMSPIATIFRPEHQLSHIGAVGTPGVNVQVAIMNEDGSLLGPNQTGEIVYRSPHVTEHYLADEAASDAAFRHGWFHSGDTGNLGDDGMLWFEDRSKDVIKTGGENVASIEVEKLVYEVAPEVAQAVVIGLPHDHWGEAITVVAVAKTGEPIDGKVIIDRLKQKLSPFKVPKAVIVCDALPMTSTGKIQKHVLRQEHKTHYK